LDGWTEPQWQNHSALSSNSALGLKVKVIGGDNFIATDRCGMSSSDQRLNVQPPAVLVLLLMMIIAGVSGPVVAATQGKYPVRSKTPLGFQDEVILFWPLLIQLLNLRGNSQCGYVLKPSRN